MTFEKPLPVEFSAVYSVAKGLGFNYQSIERVGHLSDDIWFDGGQITNRPFDSVLPKNPVTFTEFITAMVTPEKTSVTDVHGFPFQAEGKAQRGEPKEVSGKKSMEDLLKELKETPIKMVTIPTWIQEQDELFDAEMKHRQMLFHRDMEKYMEHVDRILFKRPSTSLKEEDRSHMSPVQRISILEAEVEALKQKLAEAEKKVEPEKEPMEEDRRVYLGGGITFKAFRPLSHKSAFIGDGAEGIADTHRVLIANEGYTFKIREDYCQGRPALEIHRL